jgi:hypothetical protein
MFHRFGWLWVLIALPLCVAAAAVAGMVAADLVESNAKPAAEIKHTHHHTTALPPCCCQDGCALPTNIVPYAVSAVGQPKRHRP